MLIRMTLAAAALGVAFAGPVFAADTMSKDQVKAEKDRIAQEAISNAVRHGKAQHVYLRLRDAGGVLVMQIDDDGRGIASASPSVDGMGLRIMRYRARMIGASSSDAIPSGFR